MIVHCVWIVKSTPFIILFIVFAHSNDSMCHNVLDLYQRDGLPKNKNIKIKSTQFEREI